MFSLLKAAVAGGFLSVLVSLFIGSGGGSAGFLDVHSVLLWSHTFYWSWPLFLIGTVLTWCLMLLMA
jgi:hypothetical protein